MKRLNLLLIAFVIVATAIISTYQFANAAPLSATFVVDNVGDENDTNAGDGVCATLGGFCTLRAALEEANAFPGEDTINFALPPASSIAASSDELLITESVTINGPDTLDLMITTGFNFHRVLHVAAGANATVHISDMIIAGGVLPVGNGAGILLESSTLYLNQVRVQFNMTQNERGGGIAVQGGTLFMNGSAVTSNSAAEHGGGIYNDPFGTVIISDTSIYHNSAVMGGGAANIGRFTATNVTFEQNEAEGYGGGIYNVGGTLTVVSSEVKDNDADRGAGLYHDGGKAFVYSSTFAQNESLSGGGAIMSQKPLVIAGSIMQENSAGGGGAILNNNVLTITQTLIENNVAHGRGGGIYNQQYGVLLIDQSTIANNQSVGDMGVDRTGGGINNFHGTVTINNSTISGNIAEENAGGISHFDGTMQINNSTVAFNDSPNGGGILVGSEGVMQVRNSIIARNTGDNDCVVDAGNPNGLIAFNANLDSDGSCPLFTLSNQEPLLSILMDNGGATPTHLLDAASPAVGAASTDGCVAVNNVDQRGLLRLSEGDDSCDLGAVELNGTQPPAPEVIDTPPAVDPEPEEEVEEEEVEEEEEEAPELTDATVIYLPSVER